MNTHVVDNFSKGSAESIDNEVVSLVEAVTVLLLEAGHPTPDYWLAGLHPDAFATSDQSVQRFLINRYWRMQIQALPVQTIDVRYCLMDEKHVSSKDWLRVFKQGVLPCIMQHKLGQPPMSA